MTYSEWTKARDRIRNGELYIVDRDIADEMYSVVRQNPEKVLGISKDDLEELVLDEDNRLDDYVQLGIYNDRNGKYYAVPLFIDLCSGHAAEIDIDELKDRLPDVTVRFTSRTVSQYMEVHTELDRTEMEEMAEAESEETEFAITDFWDYFDFDNPCYAKMLPLTDRNLERYGYIDRIEVRGA